MGRSFDEKILSDKGGMILNELAVRMLGLKDPLNTEVIYNQGKRKIIGVVKDFHYSSLEESIEPIMFTCGSSRQINYIMLKVENGNYQSILQDIENVLKEFDSGYVPDYIILDDLFKNKYRQQEQTETLSTYASILSLVLALLGLYALSMFMVQKRAKEIGIRKVNGATRFQIIRILLTSYTRQVIIAFVIASPIAYYVLNSWLNNFAYRIHLTIMPFILSGLLALVVALITVFGQSWSVATKNPVDSLKYE